MKSHAASLAIAFATLSPLGPAAAQTKPPAQYWMSVSTQNMTIPGMAAGEMSSMGAILGGLGGPGMGGFGGPQRSLLLQLVAPGTVPGPQAQHEIPPGQRMGNALPLRTPVSEARRAGPGREAGGEPPEKPRGRMLFYWGCGETVRAGQPRVVDVAAMSPQDYAGVFRGRSAPRQSPPAPRSGWTYGDWPNEERPVPVPADSSLVGNHVVRGNYPPEIPFGLDARRDFMDPVTFTQVAGTMSDAIRLEWRAIPTATGYLMTAVGANQASGDTVFWSSSETQELGWGLMDYLPTQFVRELVRDKVALAPDVTRCAIPRGVFKDIEGASLQFIAWGDELNLAHPPRPADPKAPWNPVWTVKVRLKSTGMLALSNEALEGAPGGRRRSDTAPERARETPPAARRETQKPAEPAPGDASKEVLEGVRKLRGIFGF